MMNDAPAPPNPDVQEEHVVQVAESQVQTQEPQQAEPTVPELGFDTKHNICAFLKEDIVDRAMFGDVIAFLHRSRINYAIFANVHMDLA